jgi:hypothetical protein
MKLPRCRPPVVRISRVRVFRLVCVPDVEEEPSFESTHFSNKIALQRRRRPIESLLARQIPHRWRDFEHDALAWRSVRPRAHFHVRIPPSRRQAVGQFQTGRVDRDDMSLHSSRTRRRPSCAVIAPFEERFQADLRIVIACRRNRCTVFQVDEHAFAGGKKQAGRISDDCSPKGQHCGRHADLHDVTGSCIKQVSRAQRGCCRRSLEGGTSAFAKATADRRSLGGGWLVPPMARLKPRPPCC